eukprot:COSAG02_NODE_300_length_25279_cov_159.676529_17_plen_636_part_00
MTIAAVVLLASTTSSPDPHELHVSAAPGQRQTADSLREALALAAARPSPSSSAPLTVHLHGSVANPSELPLILGPEHSHLSIVGGTISGGVRIGGGAGNVGWKKSAGPSNVWTAATPAGLPAARQLYVDGARANRTMMWWPEKAKFTVAGSSLVSSDSAAAAMLSKLGSSVSASMLEAVFTGGGKEHAPHAAPGQHSYREARCPIVSISLLQFSSSDGGSGAGGLNMTLAEPCYSRARTLSSCSTPSYVSNSRQLLLDGAAPPGSFFFDNAKAELLFEAPAGWDPSKSKVILPVNQTLVQIKAGTKGVSFTGVVFEHAGWLDPNEPDGYVDDQAGTQVVEPSPPGSSNVVLPNKTIPANVVVEGGAHEVLFDSCTFRHLGGTALHFQAGAQHSTVERTEFYDISASAVIIGNVTDWNEKDVSKQTLNITVRDSVVSSLPQEYHGAVAVSVFIAAQASILHNEISGCSYSAVSVGWGWDSKMGTSSYARENKVIGNHFHDTMQMLFDGGDFYTLGSQPRSEAAFNHIHGHKGCMKTNGLYHDQGTAHWTDHHNVVELGVGPHPCRSSGRDAAAWAIMWIDSIHDCHLYSNFADTNVSVNWDHTGADCSINDTTIFPPGGPIPPAAQAIIDAAGPRG